MSNIISIIIPNIRRILRMIKSKQHKKASVHRTEAFLFRLIYNRSIILTSESKQVEESGEAAYKSTQRAV